MLLEKQVRGKRLSHFIVQYFKDRVQAGAGTGKAASNYEEPTVHLKFRWSQLTCQQVHYQQE
jgi:hypothetical protein